MQLDLYWPEIMLRLALAVLTGLHFGFNRGGHERLAGLHTATLVSLTATTSTLLANARPTRNRLSF